MRKPNAVAAFFGAVFVSILTACASGESGRYKDNVDLERPPESPAGEHKESASADTDVEAPPRRRGIGLKSDVYKLEGGLGFEIKRPYDEAWLLLHQAIEHNELKITDQDRSKGTYYVNFGGHSLLNLTSSLFANQDDEPTYLIKVEGQGDETSATFSLANKEEQTNSAKPKNGNQDNRTDKSEDLLELLFDTLHDHIKAD